MSQDERCTLVSSFKSPVASVTGNIRLDTVNIGQFFPLQTARTEPLSPPQLAALSFGPAEAAVFLLNGLLLAVGLQLEERKRWLQHSAGVPLMFERRKRKWTAATCFFVE